MDLVALITEFAAARRALMDDPGVRGGRPTNYLVERRAAAMRYNAAADALEVAADQIAAAAAVVGGGQVPPYVRDGA